jgi:flagellar biosynthetic protein FlhB
MAMSRMMQNVPKADVVVTNPTHFAVALSYRGDEMGAPKVIAKGQDLIAQRIKQIARENGVPVVENKLLARTLFKTVEVEQEIPYELFQAVAQVLAYIYSLKKRPSQAAYSAPVGV